MSLSSAVLRNLCDSRISYYMRLKILQKRRFGVHPINQSRNEYGEFHHLYKNPRNYPDRFWQYMRMTVESFDFLLSKIVNSINKPRSSISAEQRLVLLLRYLATGHSFRDLAFAFRLGRSTVSNIICEASIIIWNTLVDEYMPTPTADQLQKVTDDYYKRWKFPNCLGSIDGKHCQIKCPAKSGSHYFNYLHYFSIVLQAVADADKKFVTIEVGGRGKQSDGGAFCGSTLFRMLEAGKFNIPPPRALPGSNTILPNFLIGDEAYPLKTYLLRPYPRKKLNAKTEKYNERLSIARKCIECAFGILSRKWRILQKEIETKPSTAIHIIKCACILHNFVRDRDGDTDLDYIYTTTEINDGVVVPRNVNIIEEQSHCNRSSQAAIDVRNNLTNYFWDFTH